MKIVRWKDSYTSPRHKGQIIRVTKNEALQLIRSLITQLLSNDPDDREGFETVNDEYFSISVRDDADV